MIDRSEMVLGIGMAVIVVLVFFRWWRYSEEPIRLAVRVGGQVFAIITLLAIVVDDIFSSTGFLIAVIVLGLSLDLWVTGKAEIRVPIKYEDMTAKFHKEHIHRFCGLPEECKADKAELKNEIMQYLEQSGRTVVFEFKPDVRKVATSEESV